MKHILMTLTLIFTLPALAGFKNAAEAEAKLKSFSSDQFKNKELKDQEKLEDDIVDSLIDAVEVSVKETTQLTLKKEIVRVAVILLKQDKSLYGAELVLPLFKQNRTEFQSLIKTLPPKDSRLLDQSVKDAAREEDKGNG